MSGREMKARVQDVRGVGHWEPRIRRFTHLTSLLTVVFTITTSFFCFTAFLSILDTPIYIQTEKQPYIAVDTFALTSSPCVSRLEVNKTSWAELPTMLCISSARISTSTTPDCLRFTQLLRASLRRMRWMTGAVVHVACIGIVLTTSHRSMSRISASSHLHAAGQRHHRPRQFCNAWRATQDERPLTSRARIRSRLFASFNLSAGSSPQP